MSSSVSVVRGRKFLNACDIWFSFMSISYMYLFRLVILNPIKNGCPFIKHYINATSFKIIQLDARTGVLGQLAVNRKGFRAEFFSAKCFSIELEYWWEGIAISNFLNFHMTFSILANFRLRSGSMWFFRVNTFQVERRFGKNFHHRCIR